MHDDGSYMLCYGVVMVHSVVSVQLQLHVESCKADLHEKVTQQVLFNTCMHCNASCISVVLSILSSPQATPEHPSQLQ